MEHSAVYPAGSILQHIGGRLPCYITYTTEATRPQIIRSNLHKSPLYSGIIHGIGPTVLSVYRR